MDTPTEQPRPTLPILDALPSPPRATPASFGRSRPRVHAASVILLAQGITQLLATLVWLALPLFLPGSTVSGMAGVVGSGVLWAVAIVSGIGLGRGLAWSWWLALATEAAAVLWLLLALLGIGLMSPLNLLVAAAVAWLLLTEEGRSLIRPRTAGTA
jgi:hypothetical protein